jgi:hypothetical protein
MRFLEIGLSPKATKRLLIKFAEPDIEVHFGSKTGSTFIDHGDKKKRENYLRRHSVLEDWRRINPGSLSRYLLWGDSTDLGKNLRTFLKDFDIEVV